MRGGAPRPAGTRSGRKSWTVKNVAIFAAMVQFTISIIDVLGGEGRHLYGRYLAAAEEKRQQELSRGQKRIERFRKRLLEARTERDTVKM